MVDRALVAARNILDEMTNATTNDHAGEMLRLRRQLANIERANLAMECLLYKDIFPQFGVSHSVGQNYMAIIRAEVVLGKSVIYPCIFWDGLDKRTWNVLEQFDANDRATVVHEVPVLLERESVVAYVRIDENLADINLIRKIKCRTLMIDVDFKSTHDNSAPISLVCWRETDNMPCLDLGFVQAQQVIILTQRAQSNIYGSIRAIPISGKQAMGCIYRSNPGAKDRDALPKIYADILRGADYDAARQMMSEIRWI